MPQRSYAIIGAGALGGYYGGLLARAGKDTHFLLRSDYEHVRKHGLRVDSPNGDFLLPEVHAYGNAGDMPRCDVVCVCLKATDNGALPGILPSVVKPDGIVVLLQNGVDCEPAVAELIPKDTTLLGGLAFLCSNKVGPGHINHLDYGQVLLAEYRAGYKSAGISPAVRAVGEDLDAAGIRTELSEDLLLARWKKLVWNIPFNGLSVVLDATTDEIMGLPETRKLVQELMTEVQTGAASLGREVEQKHLETMFTYTEQMTPYKTSMKLDAEAGRPLEVEAMFGAPLRMAQEHGAELPRIQMLYAQLRLLSKRAHPE